jgi:hypothetical protein
VIGTSHMGVAADEPVLSTGTPAPSVNLQTVVAALAKRGITATVEYPGFLQVSAGAGRDWNIGTANPTWGADLVSGLGDVMQSANLGIPSTSTDVERIADKIQELVR